MTRIFKLGIVAILFVLGIGTSQAYGQQIVTDPELNQQLITFQQNFPQFVSDHPGLTSGASDINIEGAQKKVSFSFQQQGQYNVTYGNLVFSPTTPISPRRFLMSLDIQSITHTGSAAIDITDKKGRNFNMQCQDNSFAVGAVKFTSEVIVPESGTVVILNRQVNFDPKTVVVSIPCLKAKQTPDQFAADAEFDDAWQEDLGQGLIDTALAERGSSPSKGTLNTVNATMQALAAVPGSSVATSTTEAVTTNGTMTAASAPAPCNGTVQADIQLVITDLSAISAQAQAQGFQTAVQTLTTDLRTIIPTLTAPSQSTVQKFIDDLNKYTASTSMGGTTITAIEQAVLINDFNNVVLSTGITSTQLTTLQTDLVGVLNTLSGISTAQLQTDFQKLIADVQTCLNK